MIRPLSPLARGPRFWDYTNNILGRPNRGTPDALEVLLAAVDDEAPEVRLQAIGALGEWGPGASAAVPALVARLNDPVKQVIHWADCALWAIDAAEGAKASGWRRVTSAEFGFSVEMPDAPKREDKQAALAPLLIHSFQAPHRAGSLAMPTIYTVTITDYPPEVLQATTEEQRLDSYRQSMGLFRFDAKMARDQPIALQGRKGREHVIEAKDMGTIHSRLFWSGRRLYLVFVAGQPQFLNKRAAEYFRNSFRFEDSKAKSTGKRGAPPHGASP